MSRKYSIGFIIGMIIFIALIFVGYKLSYNHAIERNEEIQEQMIFDNQFVIKNKEGYVTVYKNNGQVYEYTSLLCLDLPISIQEDLKNGIIVDNIGEVYGFLENYSS